ncbi:hypothetical protein EDC01DRAFT_632981 [Geopyxis carbonaria]|nr:hypothetical protein EDC01DRAFT_632981 [Geopyxis carbonaria]
MEPSLKQPHSSDPENQNTSGGTNKEPKLTPPDIGTCSLAEAKENIKKLGELDALIFQIPEIVSASMSTLTTPRLKEGPAYLREEKIEFKRILESVRRQLFEQLKKLQDNNFRVPRDDFVDNTPTETGEYGNWPVEYIDNDVSVESAQHDDDGYNNGEAYGLERPEGIDADVTMENGSEDTDADVTMENGSEDTDVDVTMEEDSENTVAEVTMEEDSENIVADVTMEEDSEDTVAEETEEVVTEVSIEERRHSGTSVPKAGHQVACP